MELSSIAFLGAGGNNPRVDVASDSGEVVISKKLPPLHSAYALDTSSTGKLVVGTRGGVIRLHDESDPLDHNNDSPFVEYFQGAPVLSVCWCNKSFLAASDSAGRCLLWNTHQTGDPLLLKSAEGLICSLVNLPNDLLAGCSAEGKMMLWQIPEGRLIKVSDIPTPPALTALVQMTYWASQKTLVCPGPRGKLTLYDVDTHQIRTLDAHQGDVYAISIWEDELVTVGTEDGRLRHWQNGQGQPAGDFSVPKGTLSMAISEYSPARIVLVNMEGNASVHILTPQGLELVTRMPGKSYRVVASRDPSLIRSIESRKKEQAASEIAILIQKNMDRDQWADLNAEYAKLDHLGYSHVSLVLRAEQALRQEKISHAIELYAALIPTLPANHPNNVMSMAKYTSILMKAWCIPQAKSICETVLKTAPEHPISEQLKRLTRIQPIIENEFCIIEPNIPLKAIIESATVLGSRFKGKYLFKKFQARLCPKASLTLEEIATKYNQCRMLEGESFPEAEIKEVCWLSATDVSELGIVFIGHSASNGTNPFKYALQVFSDELNTTVVPAIVFDWVPQKESRSHSENNQHALEALRKFDSNDLHRTFLGALHKTVIHALRRLITENRSKGNFK